MTAFIVVWFGQFISFLGSGMTRFALSFRAWVETGRWQSINPSPYAYMPFSAGARMCIGAMFA